MDLTFFYSDKSNYSEGVFFSSFYSIVILNDSMYSYLLLYLFFVLNRNADFLRVLYFSYAETNFTVFFCLYFTCLPAQGSLCLHYLFHKTIISLNIGSGLSHTQTPVLCNCLSGQLIALSLSQVHIGSCLLELEFPPNKITYVSEKLLK